MIFLNLMRTRLYCILMAMKNVTVDVIGLYQAITVEPKGIPELLQDLKDAMVEIYSNMDPDDQETKNEMNQFHSDFDMYIEKTNWDV